MSELNSSIKSFTKTMTKLNKFTEERHKTVSSNNGRITMLHQQNKEMEKEIDRANKIKDNISRIIEGE